MNKNPILIAVLVAAAFSATPAIADKTAPTDKGTQSQLKSPNVTEFDKQAAQVQENLKLMQEQMDKISQTQNPQERHMLLQEHSAAMQRVMGMMGGMWGPGMMGCCEGGPMMGGRSR